MQPGECNSLQKNLTSEGTDFMEKCTSAFDANQCGGEDRVAVTRPGPSYLLGLDELLAVELDERRCKHQSDVITAAVLDREWLATLCLACMLCMCCPVVCGMPYSVSLHNIVHCTLVVITNESIQVNFIFFVRHPAATLRTQRAVLKTSGNDQLANKEMLRISGISWGGIRHLSSFCGHLPVSLGAFVYQVEGNRLVSVIDAMDLLGCMENIPAEITPDQGPDLIKAPHMTQQLQLQSQSWYQVLK